MPSLAVAMFAPSPSSFLVNKDDIKLWLLRLQVKLWHRQSWVIGVIMPHSMQYYYFSWQTHRQTQPVPSYHRSWDIVTGSRQVASIPCLLSWQHSHWWPRCHARARDNLDTQLPIFLGESGKNRFSTLYNHHHQPHHHIEIEVVCVFYDISKLQTTQIPFE